MKSFFYLSLLWLLSIPRIAGAAPSPVLWGPSNHAVLLQGSICLQSDPSDCLTPGVTGNPAGFSGQVQYNNAGNFGANSNLTFDGTNLTVGGLLFPTGGSITDDGSGGENFQSGNARIDSNGSGYFGQWTLGSQFSYTGGDMELNSNGGAIDLESNGVYTSNITLDDGSGNSNYNGHNINGVQNFNFNGGGGIGFDTGGSIMDDGSGGINFNSSGDQIHLQSSQFDLDPNANTSVDSNGNLSVNSSAQASFGGGNSYFDTGGNLYLNDGAQLNFGNGGQEDGQLNFNGSFLCNGCTLDLQNNDIQNVETLHAENLYIADGAFTVDIGGQLSMNGNIDGTGNNINGFDYITGVYSLEFDNSAAISESGSGGILLGVSGSGPVDFNGGYAGNISQVVTGSGGEIIDMANQILWSPNSNAPVLNWHDTSGGAPGLIFFSSGFGVSQQSGDILAALGGSKYNLITSPTVLGRATAIPAYMPFNASLTSIVSNQMASYGKATTAATIISMQATATSFTCVSNPAFTLYDCGTSAGACTSGRTALASVTLTGANTGTDGTVSSSALAAGHYWAVEVSGGTCTSLNIVGTAQYN